MFLEENCAGANFTQYQDGTWGWADTRCDAQHPFICQIPLPAPPPPSPAPPSGVWWYTSNVRRDGYCGAIYSLGTDLTMHGDAVDTCKGLGGGLAIYGSVAEQQEVEQYYVSAGYLEPTWYNFYWVGVRWAAPIGWQTVLEGGKLGGARE